MAEKTILDSLATIITLANVFSKDKKRPTVRRTRTARQVLDKHGNVVTLYTVTETITKPLN